MIDQSILQVIAITDHIDDGLPGLLKRAAQAARGGATCIQVRLKNVSARDLAGVAREIVRNVSVPVIVNDRADVAIAAGAAGVHLGPDDIPPAAVRKFAPDNFIIGASVGNESEIANADGADYVGIGPFFSSFSKSDAGNPIGSDGFKLLKNAVGLPAVAIGGITAENAALPIAAGAAGVALIAGIFGASDPEAAARAVRYAIET